jgi:ankyrin repeat protein
MNGVIRFSLTISCFLMIASSFANSDDNYMQHKIEVNRASLKSKSNNLPHRIQAIGSRLKPGMYGWTSLMEASLTGDVKTVKSIIKQGVNLNKISDTNTALKLSTYYSHTDIVRILLKNGADPNIAGANKETALMIAASKGYIEIAKLLLNNNANAGSNEYIIRFKSKSKITSAIERAASSGHAEMVKLIISHLNNSTNTNDALLSAASRGHDNIVRTLVEAGGNPNYYNKEHDIDALHLSIGNGHYNTASLLVALGADVNQTGRKNKISPLRYAVSLRRLNITELLLNSGADIFNANIFDQSLIEIAEHNNDTSMATLLRAYKAPDNNPELIRFIKPGISILKELKSNTNKVSAQLTTHKA